MDWILVYECKFYQVFKNTNGDKKRIIYKDGYEVITSYDWSSDDLA